MNKKIFDEVVGWCGTVTIISAYALLSFGIIASESIMYHLLNAIGALGIVYISFKKKAYQPGVLNIIWALIAIVAIVIILT